MIKVVARNFIKKEALNEFIDIARELVVATRTKDAGCIRYELVQDIKDPQILTILEEWEDQSSISNHMNTEHFKKAAASMKDFIEKPGDTNLYTTLI